MDPQLVATSPAPAFFTGFFMAAVAAFLNPTGKDLRLLRLAQLSRRTRAHVLNYVASRVIMGDLYEMMSERERMIVARSFFLECARLRKAKAVKLLYQKYRKPTDPLTHDYLGGLEAARKAYETGTEPPPLLPLSWSMDGDLERERMCAKVNWLRMEQWVAAATGLDHECVPYQEVYVYMELTETVLGLEDWLKPGAVSKKVGAAGGEDPILVVTRVRETVTANLLKLLRQLESLTPYFVARYVDFDGVVSTAKSLAEEMDLQAIFNRYAASQGWTTITDIRRHQNDASDVEEAATQLHAHLHGILYKRKRRR